ncbi:MAG TPA: Fe-S cluster assembly protein SufD [Thermoleophilaceae bacterium]
MTGAAVAEPSWLAARRERAAVLKGELPLPEWKGQLGWEFSPLTGFDIEAFPAAAPADVPPAAPLLTPPSASVPDGAVVLPLAEAAASHADVVERWLGSVAPGDDPFVVRNDASWTDGRLVYIPHGVRLEDPIVISAVVDGASALHWRTLIVLDEDAEAEVWEQHLSSDDESEGVLNTVVELVVGQGSILRYVSGQHVNERTWVFGSQRAEVAQEATLDWASLGFGGRGGKVRMETKLAGDGSHAKVTGAYAGLHRQHLDFDTLQEHAAPNTTSDLAFRGVLQNRATAVWRGMIQVDPGAQKTDAFQESRNLLLSKRAHADAIPGLEIEANDVRCTHAAAVAQIDKDQLYYLMSHGLPREQATRLVIEGFLAELVERFHEGPVREQVGGALERRLAELLGS